MHRQLIALFLPQDLRQSECITELAEAWWQKVRALRAPAREGFRRDRIREAEERIERGLASLIDALRSDSRKWRYLLEASLGGTFNSLPELRVQIETHLEVVTRAAQDLAMEMIMLRRARKRGPLYRSMSEASMSMKTQDLNKMSPTNEPRWLIPR